MVVTILWIIAATICFGFGLIAVYITLACVFVEGHSWDSYSPLVFTAIGWLLAGSIIHYVL